jgi:hypothetical protein
MTKRITRSYLLAALAIGLSVCSYASAQNPAQNNQPVVGSVHKQEARIQRKLQQYYKQGRIDSNELARFQRDFDGICVKEDAARMKEEGLTDQAQSSLMKKLDLFEADLDKHAAKSGPSQRPPAEPK